MAAEGKNWIEVVSVLGAAIVGLLGGLYASHRKFLSDNRKVETDKEVGEMAAAATLTTATLTAQNIFAQNLSSEVTHLTARITAAEDKALRQQIQLDQANTEIQSLKTSLEEKQREIQLLTHKLKLQEMHHEEQVQLYHDENIRLRVTIEQLEEQYQALRVEYDALAALVRGSQGEESDT